MKNPLFSEAFGDAQKVRNAALKNAKIALKETFDEKYGEMFDEKLKEKNMKKENKNHTDMKSRFHVLAGIVQEDTLATLTIPNGSTIVEFKTLPTWFEKLKYKLCGFECSIVREKSYATPCTNFNDANKTLNRNTIPDDEGIDEKDINGLIEELEAEVESGK